MIGTQENPLRVAVIGSGPAGFYAAGQLLGKKAQHVARVDVFDRLPTPWGLVRAGVAPDHPNIKAVSRVFEKTAGHEGFRFFGNVELGRDLDVSDLRRHYHAVIFAVGAQSDRRMGIPGEELPGSWGATDFVAWYNAHPDYRHLDFDLNCARAVVVGNGNVALDVARMVALTHDELRVTDVADHALEALRESQIREIVVLGRRGPLQAAFTNPELRELGEMIEADVSVEVCEADLDPLSRALLDESDITARKNVDILTAYSKRPPAGRPTRLVLRFLASPVEILGDERVEGIVIERNELVRDEESGALRARPTGERETISCGLVLRSIGYRGVALPGVPFDEPSAVIPNDGGRVLEDGEPRRGEYVTGWIKRGPSGVIGTNKKDSGETVALLLADLEAERLLDPPDPDTDAIEDLLRDRGVEVVTQEGWEAIDEHERGRGEPSDRPRAKLTSFEELLEQARAGARAGAR
ncbi:MAG: FAD-dependent oxidoreductase [Solirubrobacteraceae bacterium]